MSIFQKNKKRNESEVGLLTTIQEPVFHSSISIFLSPSQQTIIDWAKKTYEAELQPSDGNPAATTWSFLRDCGPTNIIWVSSRRALTQKLHHEILHAVFFVLRYAGVTLSSGSEETYTYLFDAYVELVQQKIKELYES